MRVWKSSRGQGAVKVLDKGAPPVLRAPVTSDTASPAPVKVDRYREEMDAIVGEIHAQGFKTHWNLKMGIDQFVSFWKHESGAILLLHWFRDTGAVEVYRPISSDTLEGLYEEIERYVTEKEEANETDS